MTATIASASKTLNTRAQGLGDGALDLLDRVGLERERLGLVGKRRCRGGSGAGREAHGEGIGAQDAKRVRRVLPADEDRLAARAGHGALDDAATVSSSWCSESTGSFITSPTCNPRRLASPTGRIAAPLPSIAVSAAVRSPWSTVSLPSARKSAPTMAAASMRIPRKAMSKEAIGVTRATPWNGGEGGLDLLVRPTGGWS
jgi:hypothetical protein